MNWSFPLRARTTGFRSSILLSLIVFLPFAGLPASFGTGELIASGSAETQRPEARADQYQILQEGELDITSPGVLINDVRAESAMLVDPPEHGSIVFRDDGSFTYNHDGSDTAADAFTYRAYNEAGASETVTVNIKVALVSFSVSELLGHAVTQPTSIQFGPDDRLYVLRKKGMFNVLELTRNAANDYSIVNEEIITMVRFINNHDDDGELNEDEKIRQATGMYVAGTADNPVVYINSSDPRVGGHGNDLDTGLDTNSGVLSRVSWIGTSRDDPTGFWEKVDLVRGLPRSEENHAPNGLHMSATGDTLFMTVGGSTNGGAPSTSFAWKTEYALEAAILSIDLSVIEAMPTLTDSEGTAYKYNLPTLDDPTRPNENGIDDPEQGGYNGIDINDPWGGNDGLNQAKIVPGGPVQIYSPGYRNAYDIEITSTPGREGRMYVVDNGPNRGWGGHPVGEGPSGVCTNDYDPAEPGSTTAGPNDPPVNNEDGLHYVRPPQPDGTLYYGGHPAPIRGNPAGAGLWTGDYNLDPELNTGVFRDGTDPIKPLPVDWPPVPVSDANPVECDYQNAGISDSALIVYGVSTNGITEYTASNFDNALKGDLFATGYNNETVYRVVLNEDGDQVTNGVEVLAENFGEVPLDITAVPDDGPFPGTMWVVGFVKQNIFIFEPSDYDGGGGVECTGAPDNTLDEDDDGYDNQDELDNGTNPCSAASRPADNDLDLISDLNDSDDDNDSIADVNDPFAIDPNNGTDLDFPFSYPLLNEDPATGFFGLGFTGLMINGSSDYLDLHDPDNLVPGGTAGLFTIVDVPEGGVSGGANSLQNGFQVGLNAGTAEGPFTVRVRMPGPFFNGSTPASGQQQGAYVGTGDMDNYVLIALDHQSGTGGYQVVSEIGGSATSANYPLNEALDAVNIDLYFSINPSAGTIQPVYSHDSGPLTPLGSPINASGDLLKAINGTYTVSGLSSGMALGIMATSDGAGGPFTATWDHVEVIAGETIPSSLLPDETELDFGTVTNGDTQILDILVTNSVGNLPLEVTDASVVGANKDEFMDTFSGPVTLNAGESTTISIEFTPSSAEAKTATLKVFHNGANGDLAIPLSGEGEGGALAGTSTILFRVNAGGPEIPDGDNLPWDEDQTIGGGSGDAESGTPHPFVNAIANGDKTFGKDETVALDASVPAGTPAELFQRGRWDPFPDPTMRWDIPIPAGEEIEVRLYFSEQHFQSSGDSGWPRVFDVKIDGVIPPGLDNLHIFGEAGHDVGIMKSVVTVSDGTVDINFINLNHDPIIQGIEIIGLEGLYLDLEEGWNLVGIPIEPADPSYDEVFNTVSITTEPFEWDGDGYEETTNLESGTGYWVKTESNGVQVFASILAEEITMPVNEGWNMISGPGCTLPVDEIDDPTSALLDGTLFYYDSGYQAADNLMPGFGYWIKSSKNSTITMNCASVGKGMKGDGAPNIPSTFGRLAIFDAENGRQMLYFGETLEVPEDMAHFAMPPLAPGEGLDARFGGDTRLAEGDEAYIGIRATSYPLRVVAEALPTRYAGGLVIEELVQDEVVRVHHLAANGSFEIHDESVKTLRIGAAPSNQAEIPNDFALRGNYPNPFNPTTNVLFDMPEAGTIQIGVYDMLGRRVMDLPEISVAAGSNRQVEIDASSLASGVYVYRVRAEMASGITVNSGVMTLLK